MQNINHSREKSFQIYSTSAGACITGHELAPKLSIAGFFIWGKWIAPAAFSAVYNYLDGRPETIHGENTLDGLRSVPF